MKDVIDYMLPEMPNGEMVGAVCKLTYEANKLLDGTNEGFIAAETLIRNHVWKEAQTAFKAVLSMPVSEDKAQTEYNCLDGSQILVGRVYNTSGGRKASIIAITNDLISGFVEGFQEMQEWDNKGRCLTTKDIHYQPKGTPNRGVFDLISLSMPVNEDKPKHQCAGRRDGYGGFTCVTCGEYNEKFAPLITPRLPAQPTDTQDNDYLDKTKEEKEKSFNIYGKHVGYTETKYGIRYFEGLEEKKKEPKKQTLYDCMLDSYDPETPEWVMSLIEGYSRYLEEQNK